MADGKREDELVQLETHYIKSQFFRVVLAEGAFGGVSPRGNITFSFYNERYPIPQKTAVELRHVEGSQFQSTGPERITEARTGTIREVETQVTMSVENATAFHQWLGEQLKNLQQQGGNE